MPQVNPIKRIMLLDSIIGRELLRDSTHMTRGTGAVVWERMGWGRAIEKRRKDRAVRHLFAALVSR